MHLAEPEPFQTPPPARAEELKVHMRHIARRQWWMWSSAVLVSLLLTLGIASFAFPGLMTQAENSLSNDLDIAMRGLIGLVLIFNIYTIYQQLQIHRIQADLSKQVDALGRVEERTDEVYRMAGATPATWSLH